MTRSAASQPPPTVIAAVVLLLGAFALRIGSVFASGWHGDSGRVAAVLAGLLGLGFAWALWRGNGAARWLVAVIMVSNLVKGMDSAKDWDLSWFVHMAVPLAIALLLFGPTPSRHWFDRRTAAIE